MLRDCGHPPVLFEIVDTPQSFSRLWTVDTIGPTGNDTSGANADKGRAVCSIVQGTPTVGAVGCEYDAKQNLCWIDLKLLPAGCRLQHAHRGR